MLRPDYTEFSRLAREFTLIPVVKSVTADLLTPVSAFLAIAANESDAFLLESVERGEQIGRYTFLGARPYLRSRGKRQIGRKTELDAMRITFQGPVQVHQIRRINFQEGVDFLNACLSADSSGCGNVTCL